MHKRDSSDTVDRVCVRGKKNKAVKYAMRINDFPCQRKKKLELNAKAFI